ncbi:MAG: hypothetical protein AB8B55_10390 [Mariniblastus sp.]
MKRYICLGLTLVFFGGCCNSGCKTSLLDRFRSTPRSVRQVANVSQCGCSHCAQQQTARFATAENSADCGCEEAVSVSQSSSILVDSYASQPPKQQVENVARPELEPGKSSRYYEGKAKAASRKNDYKPEVQYEFLKPKTDESGFLTSEKLVKPLEIPVASEPETNLPLDIVNTEIEEDDVPFVPISIIPISNKKEVPTPVILDEVTPEPFEQFNMSDEPDVELPAMVEKPLGPIVLKARPVQNHRVNDARINDAHVNDARVPVENHASVADSSAIDGFGLPVKGDVYFRSLPSLDGRQQPTSQFSTSPYGAIKSRLETKSPNAITPLENLDVDSKSQFTPLPDDPTHRDKVTTTARNHRLIEVPAKATKLKRIPKPIEMIRLSATTAPVTNAGNGVNALANFRMESAVIKRSSDTGSFGSGLTQPEIASDKLHSSVPLLRASARLITVDR